MNHKIKVLVCDDHSLFREGVKTVLQEAPDIQVVGEACNGMMAVDLATRLRPGIVLMDIAMPDLTGFEATRRIRKAVPRIRILILTIYGEEEMVARCLDAGASGYLVKDSPPSQLIDAIRYVHKGFRYLSPNVLGSVVDHYVTRSDSTRTRYDQLSDREREILKLLADGFSVKEVAARLRLSAKTVETHKYNLMRKLDIHDMARLIKYAIRERLVEA